MRELCFEDSQQVGGGNPIALVALALGFISQAGPIRDFADGLFDGFGKI
jgi:hypothetical protein